MGLEFEQLQNKMVPTPTTRIITSEFDCQHKVPLKNQRKSMKSKK